MLVRIYEYRLEVTSALEMLNSEIDFLIQFFFSKLVHLEGLFPGIVYISNFVYEIHVLPHDVYIVRICSTENIGPHAYSKFH